MTLTSAQELPKSACASARSWCELELFNQAAIKIGWGYLIATSYDTNPFSAVGPEKSSNSPNDCPGPESPGFTGAQTGFLGPVKLVGIKWPMLSNPSKTPGHSDMRTGLANSVDKNWVQGSLNVVMPERPWALELSSCMMAFMQGAVKTELHVPSSCSAVELSVELRLGITIHAEYGNVGCRRFWMGLRTISTASRREFISYTWSSDRWTVYSLKWSVELSWSP